MRKRITYVFSFLLSSLILSCSSIPASINIEPNTKGVKSISFPFGGITGKTAPVNASKMLPNGDFITLNVDYDYNLRYQYGNFIQAGCPNKYRISRFTSTLDTVWSTTLECGFTKIVGLSYTEKDINVVVFHWSNPTNDAYTAYETVRAKINLRKIDIQSGRFVEEKNIFSDDNFKTFNEINQLNSSYGFLLYYGFSTELVIGDGLVNEKIIPHGTITALRYNHHTDSIVKFTVPFTKNSLLPVFDDSGNFYVPNLSNNETNENSKVNNSDDIVVSINQYPLDTTNVQTLTGNFQKTSFNKTTSNLASYDYKIVEPDKVSFTFQSAAHSTTVGYSGYIFDFKSNQIVKNIQLDLTTDSTALNFLEEKKKNGSSFFNNNKYLDDFRIIETQPTKEGIILATQLIKYKSNIGNDRLSYGSPTELFSTPYIIAFDQNGQVLWDVMLPEEDANKESRLQSFIDGTNLYIFLRDKVNPQGFKLYEIDIGTGKYKRLYLPLSVTNSDNKKIFYMRDKTLISNNNLYFFTNDAIPATIERLYKIELNKLDRYIQTW